MKSLIRWPLPFSLLLAASGCSAAPSQDRSTMATTGADKTAILKRIGLTPPPSAQIEYVDYTNGMDDAARLLLVMPQADWTAFLADIVHKVPRSPEFAEDLNFALGPGREGWHPEAAKGLKTGQVAWGVNESENLNIGVAPAGDGKVRVFLFWHQT
jgi:hypothetical protein